ncbi:MAG: hypothetical protein WBC91_05585 [Phototrophicaceae bacterium]
MAKIVEYGTYIIDITDAMIEHRRGLTVEQLELLDQINRCAVSFVTACVENENTDLPTLYRFLDHGAPRLITLINHQSEFLLKFRKLHVSYRDALQNIHQCSVAIQNELTQMKVDLEGFMSRIGMHVPNGKEIKPRKKRLRRLKRRSTLNVDYLDGEPLPPPSQPAPQKVLYPNLAG